MGFTLLSYCTVSNANDIFQGRQTRQNSGGVADLTKGGLQNLFEFLRDKNINFLEVLR